MPIKLSYTLLQSMLWMAGKTGVTTFLKKKIGKLPKGFACPFEKIDKGHPAIISCSNLVFPKPKDWNENIHQNGYWFVEEQVEYSPPHELAAFLEKGDKPVYIGFGSVFNKDQKDETVKLIVEAMKICGKRAIISGMGNLQNLPKDILAVGGIPHTCLFDRVSVVCHHGGAGTTVAGFQAGVPSVIIPF